MGGCLKGRHIVILTKTRNIGSDNWERSKVKSWIEAQAGVLEQAVSNKTTHIVCDKETWSDQGELISNAQRDIQTGRKLFIVKLEWLITTLQESKKSKEQRYQWETQLKTAKTRRTAVDNSDEDEGSGIETMEDLLREGTKNHVNQIDLIRMKEMLDKEDQDQQEAESERQARESMLRAREARRKKEYTALVKRGIQKARNEQFGENHHIYRSHSGFAYEVILTKVDVQNNCNARIIITIYESNAEPHTYAVNMHAARTGATAANTILAALGTNFPTAHRCFCRAFHETTEVLWDDRFVAFAADSEHLVNIQQRPFESRPWTYHLPTYGPDGRSEEQHDTENTYITTFKQEPGDDDGLTTPRTVAHSLPDLGHSILGIREPFKIVQTKFGGNLIEAIELD